MSTLTVDTLVTRDSARIRAARQLFQSSSSLALADRRPAVAAEYLRESVRLERMLLEIDCYGSLARLSIDAEAASVERLAERADRYGWAELDSLDQAAQELHCCGAERL